MKTIVVRRINFEKLLQFLGRRHPTMGVLLSYCWHGELIGHELRIRMELEWTTSL